MLMLVNSQEVQPTVPCTCSGAQLETLNYRLSDLQWNAAWLFVGAEHELNDVQIIGNLCF